MSKVENIKQISKDIKRIAWSSVIGSFAIAIIGALLIIWPDLIVKILAYIVGVFFIIKGGFEIVNYFLEKGQHDFFNNGLLIGVISILVGITALVVGENIAGVFRIIIGILIIYESLVRVNTATKFAAVGISSWKYILLIALVMLSLGIFITFNTGAVVTLIGWLMVIAGIISAISDTVFVRRVDLVTEKLTK